MNTTKTKRWNGKIETLATDYLNDVMGQMVAYGDRVQFALTRGGQRPNYQVINTAGKKMAFDSNHHLLIPKADDFVGINTSSIFTLDQIKTAMLGVGVNTGSRTRVSRVGAGATRTTTAASTKDAVDAEKYEYFKNNRKTLPPNIGAHSDEITTLMRNGISAEDAFNEVIKRHF